MKKTKFNNLKEIMKDQFGNIYITSRGGTIVPKEDAILYSLDHKFEQTFDIQTNYEVRPFLWFFHRKVKVGIQAIPTGLCLICHLLEIEHQE